MMWTEQERECEERSMHDRVKKRERQDEYAAHGEPNAGRGCVFTRRSRVLQLLHPREG